MKNFKNLDELLKHADLERLTPEETSSMHTNYKFSPEETIAESSLAAFGMFIERMEENLEKLKRELTSRENTTDLIDFVDSLIELNSTIRGQGYRVSDFIDWHDPRFGSPIP